MGFLRMPGMKNRLCSTPTKERNITRVDFHLKALYPHDQGSCCGGILVWQTQPLSDHVRNSAECYDRGDSTHLPQRAKSDSWAGAHAQVL